MRVSDLLKFISQDFPAPPARNDDDDGVHQVGGPEGGCGWVKFSWAGVS